MTTIRELRTKLEQAKGQRDGLMNSHKVSCTELEASKEQLHLHEKAREVIRAVSLSTQQQLQYHISDVVSVALAGVFTDPYELSVEFVERRNTTECDLMFVRGDTKVHPLSASGGGAVDIAAFALRIASWCLETPRTRRTIILDEPMRFVSEEYREKASLMIKEVCDRLEIQFIIITHDPKLATYADRTFEVTNKRGISRVKAY